MKSKAIGFAWLMAAVGVGAVFAVGLTPLIRAIPWSWEKTIARLVGSSSTSQACGNSKAEILLQRTLHRLYPLDRGDSKFSIDVQVIAQPTANAFSELGGKILLTEGLFKSAESPEEVAGVIAHEIEHVRQRHILEGFVTYLMTIKGIEFICSGGSMTQVKWSNFFLHMTFSRSQEALADEGALRRLQKAHIDNRGFKEFFERAKEKSLIPSLLSDHPGDPYRIQMIEKFPNRGIKPLMSQEEWQTLKQYCK